MTQSQVVAAQPGEVRAALTRLKKYQLPLSPGQALLYLKQLKESATLLLLYRHFFGEEYHASQASAIPEPGQLYSLKEQEFFTLVDQKLFPLPLDYYSEAAASYGDERSEQIDIMCLGLDWWNTEVEELHFGWQLLLVLSGSCEASALTAPAANFQVETQDTAASSPTRFDPRLTAVLESIKEAGAGSRSSYTSVQLSWLEEECLSRGEPLASLPLALRIIMHDTDNLWLDPLPESPVDDAYWCIEDVALLAEAYREASQILERVEGLLHWLEADLIHFKEVVTLWNQSCSIS